MTRELRDRIVNNVLFIPTLFSGFTLILMFLKLS